MQGVCDTWCEGCIYLGKTSEVFCDYILTEMHRRGCPAGTGCTARKRPPKWEKDLRLRGMEKAQMTKIAAQEKKKAPAPPRQRNEYGGRPRELKGASLDPAYLRRMEEQRLQRLRPVLVPIQRAAIRGWRERLGLTQAEAGALLGVSGSSVGDWERGASVARWELLEKHGCKRPS